MPCKDCVAATAAAGVLTRCPEHPLKDGRLQFVPKRATLVNMTVRGREVTRLMPVDLAVSERRTPPVIDDQWPARALPAIPKRLAGFAGMEFNGMVRQKRGWHRLAGKEDAKGNPLFSEPRRWGDIVRGWD